jgi:hypothetical protein
LISGQLVSTMPTAEQGEAHSRPMIPRHCFMKTHNFEVTGLGSGEVAEGTRKRSLRAVRVDRWVGRLD